MFSASPATSYRSDRRANRLDAWKFEQVGHEWFVLLRGSQEIAVHVVAGCPGAQLVERRRHHGPYWSHRIHLPGPPDAGLRDYLDLLRHILVLCVRDGIDGAVALDFYSRSCAADQGLEYTEAGTLVRTIKSYAYAPRAQIEAAGLELMPEARRRGYRASLVAFGCRGSSRSRPRPQVRAAQRGSAHRRDT